MKNTVKIEKFIYAIIITEHSPSDGDDTIVYTFTKKQYAKKWMEKDIKWTSASHEEPTDVTKDKNYVCYVFGDEWYSWEVRRLPLQTNGVWTTPGEPVKYEKH